MLLRDGLISDDEAERRVRTGDITSELHIDHELMISDIHILLTLATRNSAIELVAWKQGREIHDSCVAGSEEIRIEPDAFFMIRERTGPAGERQTRSFFVEADRSTMSKKERPGSRRMDDKIRKYKHYIALNDRPRTNETLQRLNVGFIRVLTVTLTRGRRDSLAASAANMLEPGDRKWFFFGSLQDLPVDRPERIFDPVFVRPGDPDAHRQLLPLVAEKPSRA